VTDTTQGNDSGDAPVTPPDDTATPPDDTATPPDDTATPPDDTTTPPDDTATPPDDTATLPCLLAEPPELKFGSKLCQWTWTETLTLRACGETPVTIVDVGLETGENLACVGYHCEDFEVDAVSPMTLAPDETMEVFVHYSPPNESAHGPNAQPLFDSATVLIHFDGGQLAVPVSGLGISKTCSAPHLTMYSQGTAIADGHTVAVGTTLSFVATPTCGDGPASSWEWSVEPPDVGAPNHGR
jgi:hypothetical protein